MQISANQTQFLLVHSDTNGHMITLYSSELTIIKQLRMNDGDKLDPICCHLTGDKVYLLCKRSSAFLVPFTILYIFDLSLTLLAKLGQSLSDQGSFYLPQNAHSMCVRGNKMFLVEKTPSGSLLSTLEMRSGKTLKTTQIDCDIEHFFMVSESRVVFMTDNMLRSFDLCKAKVMSCTQLGVNVIQGVCFTKQGLILTINKNVISVF